MNMITERKILAVMGVGLFFAVACAPAPPQAERRRHSGRLVDGTGSPARVGDLAIRGDKIVAVGRVDGTGKVTIDATGLMVAPGFVDMHSHSEPWRLRHGGRAFLRLPGHYHRVFGETSLTGSVRRQDAGRSSREEVHRKPRPDAAAGGGCT